MTRRRQHHAISDRDVPKRPALADGEVVDELPVELPVNVDNPLELLP